MTARTVTEVKGARLGGTQGQAYLISKPPRARQAGIGDSLRHSV